MQSKNIKLVASCIAMLVTLVISGCNGFENPNSTDVANSGTDVAAADAGNTADAGQKAEIASVDAGNAGTDTSVQEVQQVEIAQQEVTTDAGPKPECVTKTDCDDNNLCTVDFCEQGKCSHADASGDCDDGNACTLKDTCSAGACKGTPVDCNDNNPCTDDFCLGGVCYQGVNNAPCNDNDACTQEMCSGGTCQIGTVTDCNDNNPCTIDTCDKTKGCTNTPVVCEDGDLCTMDWCDFETGACLFVNKVCDDGKAWTEDFCDSFGWYGVPGQCVAENKPNGCSKDTDCKWDGNLCTFVTCNGITGTCGAIDKNCNDNLPCTVDSCAPSKGCVSTPVNCDDNNTLTTDSCNAQGACVHTPVGTTPTPTPTTFVQLGFVAPVAAEIHVFHGVDPSDPAKNVESIGLAPYVINLNQYEACGTADGIDIAVRNPTTMVWWCGVGDGTPSKAQLSVSVNGKLVTPTFQIEIGACSNGPEGNLHLSKLQLGCP
ncbi:MAG: hypothetical protein WCT11_00805 [Candidatus Magasanikbacteria bacterium]|jgi:hypothetical protein